MIMAMVIVLVIMLVMVSTFFTDLCEKVRNQLQSALCELFLAGKQQLESAFSTSSFLLNPVMHYGAAVFLPQPKPVQIRDAAC